MVLCYGFCYTGTIFSEQKYTQAWVQRKEEEGLVKELKKQGVLVHRGGQKGAFKMEVSVVMLNMIWGPRGRILRP